MYLSELYASCKPDTGRSGATRQTLSPAVATEVTENCRLFLAVEMKKTQMRLTASAHLACIDA